MRRLQVLTRWGLGLVLGLVCDHAAWAQGQLGGAISVDSDYRLRGVSLTDNRPALSASLTYDHASGAYAGASVVTHGITDAGGGLLGHMEYVGYAVRGRDGYDWDVGVSNQDFTPYGPQRLHLRYSEAYVGVSKGDLSARLYYSPNYLRSWGTTAYLDLNAVVHPAPNWRLSGHAGALTPAGGGNGSVRTRYDLRLGVARDLRAGEVRANFTTAFPSPQALSSRTGPAVVVGGSVFF